MNDYILETKNLSKKYNAFFALNEVNIHIPKGSIYGLVGNNGAGKSTFLKLLAGHVFPTSGELIIFQKTSQTELNDTRKNMGFLIENAGFFPNMTVEQALTYYSIQKGVPNSEKMEETLVLCGLIEKRKTKCGKLSLGQKQRLGLAISMLGEPNILILDEPINGLDPSGIIEFRSILKKLNEEKKITILLSSHILSELEHIASHYGFLKEGRLLQEVSREKLLEKCASYIDLTLSDGERYAAIFERSFPNQPFKMVSDHTIRILNPTGNGEAFSRLAYENGISILEMKQTKSSLEDYYTELMTETR